MKDFDYYYNLARMNSDELLDFDLEGPELDDAVDVRAAILEEMGFNMLEIEEETEDIEDLEDFTKRELFSLPDEEIDGVVERAINTLIGSQTE